MTLQALFDEKRRTEIRDALKAGKPFSPGKRKLVDIAPEHLRFFGVSTEAATERYKESRGPFERLERQEDGISMPVSDILTRAYDILAPAAGAGAKPEGNEKPKEVKPEESGKS
jgi:hypothetical protein